MAMKLRGGRRAVAATLSLALFAVGCGGAANTTSAAPEAIAEVAEETTSDDPGLPVFVGETVAGTQLDSNDLVGQDVVVWFWAPW